MLNDAHVSDQDTYYNRERPSLTSLVEPGSHRILDLGCGAGVVGKKLKDTGKAGELVGVELFESAANRAAAHYSRVHCGDIEQMELPYGPEFDYALCGDILEHLKDPYSVVRRIHGWLKPGGVLICSVPNVRHWTVLSGLMMRGAWTYQEAGIMDRTHLRFFTRRSCERMLEEGGFAVERRQLLIFGRKFRLLNTLTLGLGREFLGTQIVTRSRKR
jgi:2-polyprenyl-3-methyl-5-hydroxy-6-metoxy-1,4-benzoquinol methylase